MTAIPASRFFDALGIVVQPFAMAEREWSGDEWIGFLRELGLNNIRGKLGASLKPVNKLKPLYANGLKHCIPVVSQKPMDDAKTKRNIDLVADNVPLANISGIESANELNKELGNAGAAKVSKAFQPKIRQWVDATKIRGANLVMPSAYVRDPEYLRLLGDLRPNVDIANMHYYNEGRLPLICGGKTKPPTFQTARDQHQAVAPGCPMFITESGYKEQSPDGVFGAGVLSEIAAAKYHLRMYVDYFLNGAAKIFKYSLIDDVARGKINHGLIMGYNHGFKKRHSFYAIKNLAALVKDLVPATTDLSYSTNAPANVHRMMLAKSDGTFLLLMHQNVESWNRSARRDTRKGDKNYVAPINVDITFDCSGATIEVIHPTYDLSVRQTASGVNKIGVTIGDHVTVIKVIPC